jgi:hypothetical protein
MHGRQAFSKLAASARVYRTCREHRE